LNGNEDKPSSITISNYSSYILAALVCYTWY